MFSANKPKTDDAAHGLGRADRLIGLGAVIASAFWLWMAREALTTGAVSLKSPPVTETAPPVPPPAADRGVLAIAKRVYAEFSDDRIAAVAGGITFFVLLALFPAIACVVSLYGLFGDRAAIAHDLDTFAGFLPGGAVTVLGDELHRLTTQRPEQLGIGFLVTLSIAVWSASGGIKALVDGLNIAYEVRETRSFLRLTALALIFTALSIVFVMGAVSLSIAGPHLLDALHFAAPLHILIWPASYALCTLMLALIYRFGPNRKQARWRWLTWGSALAAALWILGTILFSWYVQNYGSYNRTYGSLGSAVGFLTWIWLSLVVLLTGAELNCELERPRKCVAERTPDCDLIPLRD